MSSYVVPSYRSTDINLRKALLKIGRDAGVAEWPKPFMALRASRRTELERSGRFANHVLNDWFGHTGAVAETFYLQTTEDDFKTAIGGNAGGNILAHQGKSESLKTSKNKGADGASGADDALSIHPSGFEPETFGSVVRKNPNKQRTGNVVNYLVFRGKTGFANHRMLRHLLAVSSGIFGSKW